MDFHRLRVFHTVARLRSFSRAGEELLLTQPAVSKQVRELEERLGFILLNRHGRQISLTDAGRIVFNHAERVLTLNEETRRALGDLEGLKRGYLRLGASSTPGIYLIPEAIARFRERYPGVEISLAISRSEEIAKGVLRDEFDLGFVGASSEAPLQVQPFARDELLLIAPPAHPLSQGRAISASALEGETLILREAGSGSRSLVEGELRRLGLHLRKTFVLNSPEAIKRAVAAGLGLSFISRFAVVPELKRGELSTVPLKGLRLERSLDIISRKDVRLPVSALAFAALLQKGRQR